jgi:hypothetical protein
MKFLIVYYNEKLKKTWLYYISLFQIILSRKVADEFLPVWTLY